MELIPILSLVILVATISTFILAVGAYILYKVRERKGVGGQAAAPSAIPAELVTPAPITTQQTAMQQGRKTFEILQSAQQDPGFDYQQRQSPYIAEDVKGPELRPTFVTGSGSRYSENKFKKPTTGEGKRITEGQRYNEKKKFMRYTSEGYVEPTKRDKKQEDNLKWR